MCSLFSPEHKFVSAGREDVSWLFTLAVVALEKLFYSVLSG